MVDVMIGECEEAIYDATPMSCVPKGEKRSGCDLRERKAAPDECEGDRPDKANQNQFRALRNLESTSRAVP